ncbi:MAG: FAD-dependent oxidoreductase [Bryobacteraceae bacterium]
MIFSRAILLESREIAPDIRHFIFEAPEVEEFPFVPGQFVSLSTDLHGRRITRAYSLASTPAGNRFELCLNRVEDGVFSPHLFEMHPGETVDAKGPYGAFVFRSPVNDSVLVAAGTGVAPFRGMLASRLAIDDEHRFTLLFGVRHEYGLLYRDEFEELAAKHANFRFWPTLTRPEPGWTGRTGRVQQHLDEALGGRADIDVYICGLKAMVDDVRAILKAKGFERRHIVYEKYD